MRENEVRVRLSRRTLGAGTALFLISAGVASAAGFPTDARVDALVRYFDVIVFGSEI